ncbi:hypothetical protein EPI10_002744 [Gossypium australe]|uniref:Uncharacterized protein n=1 Tax=Gossypium australe TaxID=47621 RepID=A0A5B6VFB1_9ROSI|nr:hypothetical protein EPI10_002744 [Gossypium australe]
MTPFWRLKLKLKTTPFYNRYLIPRPAIAPVKLWSSGHHDGRLSLSTALPFTVAERHRFERSDLWSPNLREYSPKTLKKTQKAQNSWLLGFKNPKKENNPPPTVAEYKLSALERSLEEMGRALFPFW